MQSHCLPSPEVKLIVAFYWLRQVWKAEVTLPSLLHSRFHLHLLKGREVTLAGVLSFSHRAKLACPSSFLMGVD